MILKHVNPRVLGIPVFVSPHKLPGFLKIRGKAGLERKLWLLMKRNSPVGSSEEVTAGLPLLCDLLFNSYKKNLSPQVENTSCSLGEKVRLHLQVARISGQTVEWMHATDGARLNSNKHRFKPGCN